MPTLRSVAMSFALAAAYSVPAMAQSPATATPTAIEKRHINAAQNGVAEINQRPEIKAKQPDTVTFMNGFKPRTVIVDTAARKLYFTLSATEAYVYPIAVGKPGFAWHGQQAVSQITNWPEWVPPAEMRQRKPTLPERMAGGINNPLGAKAIYLGNTLYRIHGTNNPASIGSASSSGCIRMLNAHVVHLSGLLNRGTKVFVLKQLPESGRIMPPAAITSAAIIETPAPAADQAATTASPVQVAAR